MPPRGCNARAIVSFGDLKSLLAQRFPKNQELSLGLFMDVETVLSVVRQVDGNMPADKAYLLLSNLHLLTDFRQTPEGHLCQMARRMIPSLSSASSWAKCLALYQVDSLDALRAFDLDDNRVVYRAVLAGSLDRAAVYIERIRSYQPSSPNICYAEAGKRYWYRASFPAGSFTFGRAGMQDVEIPRNAVSPADECPGQSCERHRERREHIIIPLDDLVSEAELMSEKTGNAHYARVVSQIRDRRLLQRLAGSCYEGGDALELRDVVNLVGMVGSGKSVLMQVAVAYLAHRGMRSVLLLNSVVDVMGTVARLSSAGIDASPLVSSSDRAARLDALHANTRGMLQEQLVDCYLETPCILDGLRVGAVRACDPGSYPCVKLGDGAGRLSLACSYGGVCPSRRMQREALTSSVVVTTPAGFAMMRVGDRNAPFFQEALQSIDVVFVDEADRVQATFDALFCRDLSLQELVRSSADEVRDSMRRAPEEQLRDMNVEDYYDCGAKIHASVKALLHFAGMDGVADWSAVKGKFYTPLSLLECLDQEGLDVSVSSMLAERIMERRRCSTSWELAIAQADESTSAPQFGPAFDLALSSVGYDPGPLMKVRLAYLLKAIRLFDRIRNLADAEPWMHERESAGSSINDFLGYSYAKQQRYLPASLVGNIYGFKNEGNDVHLFRSIAFGRAFTSCYPWFETDEHGGPLGPHVLLLSGSSWMPGSFRHHVNRPVDYLLRTAEARADALSAVKAKDLGFEQKVSGSALTDRRDNLFRMVPVMARVLEEELSREGAGKALVVVNSYDQASAVADRLAGLLLGLGIGVRALSSRPRASAGLFLSRSELPSFASCADRVLVAPAASIERGHNIVDEMGRAAITSVLFAVRPMPVPGDMKAQVQKLNGLMEGRLSGCSGSGSDDSADRRHGGLGFTLEEIRAESWRQWRRFEWADRCPLGRWRALGFDDLLGDVTTGLLGQVVQVFGRMMRLPENATFPCPPHLLFADAAFRGGSGSCSYHALAEMGGYLADLMADPERKAIARALYGLFYDALKEGW